MHYLLAVIPLIEKWQSARLEKKPRDCNNHTHTMNSKYYHPQDSGLVIRFQNQFHFIHHINGEPEAHIKEVICLRSTAVMKRSWVS